MAEADYHLLNALCDNAGGAMFVLDEYQHCIYMNPAAKEMTGFDLHEVQGRPLHDVIHHTRPDGTPYELKDCPIDRAFPQRNRERGRDFFVHKDGHFYPVEYTASPLKGEDRIIGTVLEVRTIQGEIDALRRLEEKRRTLETLNRTGAMLAGKLDLEDIVQAVTDAATELLGARFGAFFYNVVREGQELQLYTLSGAPREAFSAFEQPRHTQVFAPTFADGAVLRSDNIKADPRYGKNEPFYGMPPGHLPVTSYLAAPVNSRSGEILGALIFAHEEPAVFDDRGERIVTAIAAQAAIAIDNAKLYEKAQKEIAERQKSEQHQQLLNQELNHRVKNMLATVQSFATQTLRGRAEEMALQAFQDRLLALSQSHSLIMRENWQEVDLKEIVETALAPYVDRGAIDRSLIEGAPIRLCPKIALALGMGFHELATNAAKYGSLRAERGRVEVRWREVEPGTLCITWVERDGPEVSPPERRGFGSRLLERGLAHELGGIVRMIFDPKGVIFEMHLPMPEVVH